MTRLLVLGANCQLARNTIPFLLRDPDLRLTLYLSLARTSSDRYPRSVWAWPV